MPREAIIEVKLTDPPTSSIELVGFSNPANGNDKYFMQVFTNQSSITVDHNLGKKPAVHVEDSAGDQVYGSVNHVSENRLVMNFSASFTGSIHCN